jgi:HSP20 family molecular chaperone IbpA
MADDLKPADGDLPEGARSSDRRALRDGPTRIEPGFADVATDNPLPRPASLRLVALILALVVATGFLSWRAYFYQEEGDPVASAMLAFEKQNSLTVFASRFEVVAESEYEQSIATVPVRRVRQAMIVPATVEYRLDLSAMDSGDFRWDEAAGLLTVTLPQLQTSKPNIDEANARLFTEGLLNTGGSQQALSEANSRIASEKASAFAKNPEILALARAAAKEAVSQNLAVPLEVAGFDDARIEVRFEGET